MLGFMSSTDVSLILM